MQNHELPGSSEGRTGRHRTSEAEADQLYLVDSRALNKVGNKVGLAENIRSIWVFRHFILADAKFRAFRTNQDYRLWKLWLVAYPLLEAGLYGIMFGLVLRASRGIDNYVGYLLLGMCVFTLISRMTSSGLGLVKGSMPMLRSFQFPASALVLSHSLRQAFDSLPSILVAIAAALAFQHGRHASFALLLLVPVLVLASIFGTGCMFIAGRVTAFVPDVKAIAELLIRAWLFVSAVFYPIERFEPHAGLYVFARNNPAYLFMDTVRNLVLDGSMPSISRWIVLFSWSIGLFVTGLLAFEAAESRYRKIA